MPDYEFYLVSTPLHLFLSSAIALQRTDTRHVLVFIDQADTETNFYFQQIKQWKESPFEDIYIFPGRIKGLLAKRASRKATFRKLKILISRFKPSEIYTGNDRRIEFQYSMHKSQEYGGANGNYIDEGTFTYLGRPPSLGISDMLIDSLIKKMVYGFWWENPKTIGGSNWIAKVYAAFPKLIHPLLHDKSVIEIDPKWVQAKEIQGLSLGMLSTQNISTEKLHDIDVLIALPHESIIEANKNYQKSLMILIDSLATTNKRIAIKYHPRDTAADSLNLQENNACDLLPKQVNFEALLLALNPKATIIGDFSSVLLNARWLSPGMSVYAIKNSESSVNKSFLELYQALEVSCLSPQEITHLLTENHYENN